jgi:hypothetical protein
MIIRGYPTDPMKYIIKQWDEGFNSVRTDGNFCHQGRDTEIEKKNLKLSETTDMTIHWKALEEHVLMVPLVS